MADPNTSKNVGTRAWSGGLTASGGSGAGVGGGAGSGVLASMNDAGSYSGRLLATGVWAPVKGSTWVMAAKLPR